MYYADVGYDITNFSGEDFDNVPENFDVLSKKFNNLPKKFYGNETFTIVDGDVKIVNNEISTVKKKGHGCLNVKITSNREIDCGTSRRSVSKKKLYVQDVNHGEKPSKKPRMLHMGKKDTVAETKYDNIGHVVHDNISHNVTKLRKFGTQHVNRLFQGSSVIPFNKVDELKFHDITAKLVGQVG